MKLSLVIPAYNEESILPDTIRTTTTALDQMLAQSIFSDYELIMVSDGSTDTTAQILQNAERTYPRFKAVVYTPNRGKGYAVKSGVLSSKGDCVVFTDADLAYGTDVIAAAIRRLSETDADMLIGSRPLHPEGYAGYTPLRKLASRTYLKVISIAAGFRLSDAQCGFKAMQGACGRRLFAECKTERFAFDLELLMRAQKEGLHITEMPVKIINHRESSVHIVRDSIRMLRDIRRIKKSIQ